METKLKTNNQNIYKLLSKNEVSNWIASEGLIKFEQGEKLGKNMEYFLKLNGLLEDVK